MNRKTLVTIHLYLAAFFAPFVIMVAISGGLYLAGIKGSVATQTIYTAGIPPLDTGSEGLKEEVGKLLTKAGVEDFAFEYVKVKGNTLYTRPTSKAHYVIKQGGSSVEVIEAHPSLQNSLVELHKGHGPTLFKQGQMFFAVGLLVVMLSGLWLGLASPMLKQRTLLTTAAGTLLFLLLALI